MALVLLLRFLLSLSRLTAAWRFRILSTACKHKHCNAIFFFLSFPVFDSNLGFHNRRRSVYDGGRRRRKSQPGCGRRSPRSRRRPGPPRPWQGLRRRRPHHGRRRSSRRQRRWHRGAGPRRDKPSWWRRRRRDGRQWWRWHSTGSRCTSGGRGRAEPLTEPLKMSIVWRGTKIKCLSVSLSLLSFFSFIF